MAVGFGHERWGRIFAAGVRPRGDEMGNSMQKSRILRLAAVLVAVVVASATIASVGQTYAAKGGSHSGGTASIRLNQTDPHLGDWVTFTTSGGSRIAVACYQGGLGNMVYSADQATGTSFLLGGDRSIWKSVGGSALCYAWLYQRSLSNGALAATSFTAAGAR
jgi:hypothetical protein